MGEVCISGRGQILVCPRLGNGCVIGLLALGLMCGGCQVQTVSSTQLQIHQARVDRGGLTALQDEPDLQISCAPPAGWDRLALKKTPLYVHQQWHSEDQRTAFGVAYIRTPFPLPAQMVLWFAKKQYTSSDKSQGKGQIVSEWADGLGRDWFEAENELYHVRGYAMTRGLSAWLVYTGYQLKNKPTDEQIALAAKAAESVATMSPGD